MVWEQIEKLRTASVGEMRAKYFELFGQCSRSNHKQFLFRRVAWRLQALAYGELSEQARQRAVALARDVELRIKAPQHLVGTAQQVLQPQHAVEEIRKQVATTAAVMRDGREQEKPVAELVPGDIIRLNAGDLVPADARLLDVKDLQVRARVHSCRNASTGSMRVARQAGI